MTQRKSEQGVGASVKREGHGKDEKKWILLENFLIKELFIFFK